MSLPNDPSGQLNGQLNSGDGTLGAGFGDGAPKEGSREIHDGIIISEPMDWCKKDGAIIPYRLWAKQLQAGNLANSVRQTDDRSHVKDSIVLASHGDAPGALGINSGTHNAECTPMTWSETVRFEGRNVVRHTDAWWMNHRNTWGRLHYTKDCSKYTSSPTSSILPFLKEPIPSREEDLASLKNDQQVALQGEAPIITETPVEVPESVTAPNVNQGRIDPGISSFTRENTPLPMPGNGISVVNSNNYVTTYPAPLNQVTAEPGGWFSLSDGSIVNRQTLDKMYTDAKRRRKRLRHQFETRVTATSKNCCINYHFVNEKYCKTCKNDPTSQSHHGMVEYPFRTGSQDSPGHMAPGAPSRDVALTICLSGGDTDSEHTELHRTLNSDIRSKGVAGLTIFAEVKRASFESIDNLDDSSLSPACKELYKNLLSAQYSDMKDDTPLRANTQPQPTKDNEVGKELSKAWNFRWQP